MSDILSFDWGVKFILLLQGLGPGQDIPFRLVTLLGNPSTFFSCP
jgi:hypothetical protein